MPPPDALHGNASHAAAEFRSPAPEQDRQQKMEPVAAGAAEQPVQVQAVLPGLVMSGQQGLVMSGQQAAGLKAGSICRRGNSGA